MVNTEKVYYMTKAAVFEQKEAKNALRIVSYRRKDYVLSHMLLALLAVSAAYAILVGSFLFLIVMGSDSVILNVSQMVLIIIAIVLGYALVLVFYYVISHKFYGEKHLKARQDVKGYLKIMKQIDRINEEEGKKGTAK